MAISGEIDDRVRGLFLAAHGEFQMAVDNLPFSEWGQVISDARLVAAIVDRLTFNAHIIETGTESYRLKSTRAKRTSTR